MDNLTLEEVEAELADLTLQPVYLLRSVYMPIRIARQLAAVMRENAGLKERLAVARGTLLTLDAGLHISFGLGFPNEESEARIRVLDAVAATDLTQPWRKP